MIMVSYGMNEITLMGKGMGLVGIGMRMDSYGMNIITMMGKGMG